MDTNLLDTFDFSSFDKSFDDMTSTSSDSITDTAILGDLPNTYSYNDTIIDDKDMFDVGNLKSSNYNRGTIDEKYEKKPSENLKDINIIGDKNKYSQIEYINDKYSEGVSCDNTNLLGDFYSLEIDDYPKRSTTTKPSDANNKSLGAGNTNFISKIIDKIKGTPAR